MNELRSLLPDSITSEDKKVYSARVHSKVLYYLRYERRTKSPSFKEYHRNRYKKLKTLKEVIFFQIKIILLLKL